MVNAAPKVYPNDAGFATAQETRQPVNLKIEGTIPEYVRGNLYRTGPGRYDVGETGKKRGTTMLHWFDGFTMNHRFEIGTGYVRYNSRYACDELAESIRKRGMTDNGFSFAQPRDPCESMFHKMSTLFSGSLVGTQTSGVNVGVTLSHTSQGKLMARTDANQLQEVHEETLEPLNIASYDSVAPGQLSAAHGANDPETGEFFNYTLEMRTSKYTVFKILKDGSTVRLAQISTAKAAYIHSIALTRNYVILTVWQAYITNGVKILWNKNILDSITKSWDDRSPSQFYLIPRNGGDVRMFTSPDAFFCFHIVNAFEEKEDIHLDLVRWDNHEVLTDFYVKYLSSASPEVKMADEKSSGHMARYTLPGACGQADRRNLPLGAIKEASFEVAKPANIELPIINPRYHMKAHRYVYGVHNQFSSSHDSIVKIDLLTKEWVIWSDYPKSFSSPGEPIFVQDPASHEEDGGVLLTVVLDGELRTSALVIIDARTMKVVARAQMKTNVPFGFHGSFASSQRLVAAATRA